MKKLLIAISVACIVGQTACEMTNSKSEDQSSDSNLQTKMAMNSHISIFEIPVTDISRAISFYQSILNIKIEKFDTPEMQMGILPYEGQAVTGVLIKGEGYTPSTSGITIYLNGGDDLQPILDKVESSGGQIIVPKTAHADNSGFFALFLDSEGNKMGLHSQN